MVDWSMITNNIRRHMPLSRAAKIVGCEYQHIGRLARGEVDQPRFMTGVKLLDLHYDLEPERHKALIKKL